MAGSFSSKKVARAARTGGGRRSGGNANLGFYSVLVLICIVGVSLVVTSRNDRLSGTDPGHTAPLAPSETRSGDQWYEAYGVYLCDKFAPGIDAKSDPYGITTKNDGVVYIHPQEKQYAGHNATFGRFSKGVDIKLTRNSVQLPGDPTVYKTGETKCGDKTGELVVKEWTNAKDDKTGSIKAGDPNTLLLKNNAAITIAFVPQGERNIPLPASVPNIDKAIANDAALAAQAQQAASATTEAPGATATTAAPTATTAAAPATTAAPAK